MADGFTGFKIKVGQDLASDKERCKMVREVIGPNNLLVNAIKIDFLISMLNNPDSLYFIA
jgi:hypothetical protein